MRIAITTTQVPFIKGGAEFMTENICTALKAHGHQVEVISMPFVFNCKNAIKENMDHWEKQDLTRLDAGTVDAAICLKFPAYYLQHPNKIVWLMHQHRSVYDLWDTPYGESSADEQSNRLRLDIIERDSCSLESASRIFTISKTVSDRLKKFNGINSTPLYQPPPLSDYLKPGGQNPYIFVPSRLEGLKRQELLLRAASVSKTSCNILISGTGSMYDLLQRMIVELGLQHKVRLLGHVSDQELVELYRNSLGVFFAPLNEDYGFVTLEAMQSAKPVITCTDSGGPLEFVIDGETGHIVEPVPELIAEKIDSLYVNRKNAKYLGMNALDAYDSLGLSWDNVVTTLLKSNDKRN